MRGPCIVPWCHADEVLARGYCSTHYQRERKHGHVLWRTRDCDGCGRHFRVANGRGRISYCNACRYGRCESCEALVVAKNNVGGKPHRYCSPECADEGKRKYKDCVGCGERFTRDYDGCPGEYCSVSCANKNCPKNYYTGPPSDDAGGAVTRTAWKTCRVCDGRFHRQDFPDDFDSNIVCSPECRNRYMTRPCGICGGDFRAEYSNEKYCDGCKSEARRLNWLRWYTSKGAGKCEPFGRAEIFERDGWRCQICGEPTARNASWPDPDAPSIDHIVPLSKGGDHLRRNVQTAHLRCNWSKNDRAAGSQMLLIG